jgi:hypothetical protein
MKISNVINEGKVLEQETAIVEQAYTASEMLQDMLSDVKALQGLVTEGKLPQAAMDEIVAIIESIDSEISDMDIEVIVESVVRQFRRYGDRFVRHYRCTSGPKAGRLTSDPASCGKRKDPKKVRMGKISARRKKGQRVRKTLFTKRKTQSKRLSRLNKVLRGDPSS